MCMKFFLVTEKYSGDIPVYCIVLCYSFLSWQKMQALEDIFPEAVSGHSARSPEGILAGWRLFGCLP